MTEEDDPLGLFIDIKKHNICEVCGKKITISYKKCDNCFLESKNGTRNNQNSRI